MLDVNNAVEIDVSSSITTEKNGELYGYIRVPNVSTYISVGSSKIGAMYTGSIYAINVQGLKVSAGTTITRGAKAAEGNGSLIFYPYLDE